MAVKDHSLDNKIIKAAKSEFLKYGYQGASLHKIVKKAGITTGALYTRYQGKDELFVSLVLEIFEASKAVSEAIYPLYVEAYKLKDPNMIVKVISEETKMFHQVLFEHYDACVLFFCKSNGSSIENKVKEMMDYKLATTTTYLKSISTKDIDLKGIEILASLQFHYFKEILNRGYQKEEALKAFELIDAYQAAGWKAIFEKIL